MVENKLQTLGGNIACADYVSDALMLTLGTLSGSYLCIVCSRVSEALVLTLRVVLFLNINVSSSDSNIFLRINRIYKLTSLCALLCYTVNIPF